MSLIVVITNTTYLAALSDYKYEVLIGDGTVAGSKTLKRGTITEHLRTDGWQALLERVVEDAGK